MACSNWAGQLPIMLAHNQDVKLFIAEQDDPATAMESAFQAAMKDKIDVLVVNAATRNLGSTEKMLALSNIIKGEN